MEFLVISDTHGDRAALSALLSACPGVDAVIFLGDGLREVEALAAEGGHPPILSVRGNCDSPTSPYGGVRLEEIVVSFCGHRLLLLHGHTASAKSGMGGLIALARRHGADIVLFGHTHVPREQYLPAEEGGPLWLLNPGSLGHPADGVPTFGRLLLGDAGDVLFSVGRQGVSA